jgi:PAS domain S-box-containing protein
VLSIDDSQSDARLIQDYLKEANKKGWNLPVFEIHHVSTLKEAFDYLVHDNVDVILTDLALSDSPADQTFVQLSKSHPHVPIVVLTGSSDAQLAHETVSAGAEDVLFKREMGSSLVAHTLVYAIQRRQSRSALQKAHDELERRVAERTAALEKANQELQAEIAERRRVESALRTSEETLRTLFDSAGDAIFIHDMEGNFLEVNREATERLGYSREEFLQMTPLDIDSPEDAAHFHRRAAETRAKEQNMLRIVHVSRRGRKIPVELSSRAIEYEGKPAILSIARDITERQRAEEAIRNSELKFRGVVERSTDGIVVTDENGLITDWNAAAATIFGVEAEDALGRPIWEIQYDIAPDENKTEANRRRLKAAYQSFYQTGQPFWKEGGAEKVIQRPDGERRTVQSTVFAIPTHQGVRGASIVRDVTTRRKAEVALAEANEQFKLFMDALPGSVFINDMEGKILYANAYQREMFYEGDREDEQRKTVDIVFPRNLAERFEAQNRRLRREGTLNVIETLVCRDGTERTYRTIKFLIPRQRGTPVIGGIALDITAQKEAEVAFQRIHSQLQAIMDHSTALITMIEPPNRYRMVNPATSATLGLTPEQIIGKTFHDVLPQKTADQFTERVRMVLESQKPMTVEDILPLNGTERIFMSQLFPLFHQGGQPYAVASVGTDITERKHAEEALLSSNVELERFAHAVSHDLQEPLRTISGFLNLLQRRYAGQLDAKADLFINYAVEGANRMKEMIDALLDLSRIERQGQPFEPIDCTVLLREVLSALSATLDECGAEVSYTNLPTVSADRVQLGQVFQNLISNAVKFQIRPDPQVHISAERRDDHWLFAVQDNGIGIDKEEAKYLFEPFQRLHTREEYPGTGMGLALCRRIIQRHGGQIWVESTRGEGATFKFTLPAR